MKQCVNGYLWGALLLLAFLIPVMVRAQGGGYRFLVSGDSLTSNVPMNEISPRAFRHFEQQYGVVAATQWFKYGTGYLVKFSTVDSSQYYVYITNRGMVYRTVVLFAVSGVPRDIRIAMASFDRDGYILFAGELIEGEKPLYEVGLEDAAKVRIVDLRDGEIKTVCEYSRETALQK